MCSQRQQGFPGMQPPISMHQEMQAKMDSLLRSLHLGFESCLPLLQYTISFIPYHVWLLPSAHLLLGFYILSLSLSTFCF